MPYSPERADYADEPSGMDDEPECLRGATRDWVLLLLLSAAALWCIGIAAERGWVK